MTTRVLTEDGNCYRHVVEYSYFDNGEYIEKVVYFGPHDKPGYSKAKATVWIKKQEKIFDPNNTWHVNLPSRRDFTVLRRYSQVSTGWANI